MTADATEALARALKELWGVGDREINEGDLIEEKIVREKLAALGYEVRPIDDSMGPCADCGHPHPWTPQGVIFDACRCGCQEGIPIHSVTAEAADREAAGATASLGTDVGRPTPSAAADPHYYYREGRRTALDEIIDHAQVMRHASREPDAAAKDGPSSPDGLDGEPSE